MSKPKWYFKRQPKGFRDRNPIQNAFFDSEAVGSVVGALVREGCQNSGDALPENNKNGTAVVRIFVSGDKYSVPAKDMAGWADGIWPHLAAKDNGLRTAPDASQPCRFVTLEDFDTTGLWGSMTSDEPCKEPFYCFFRAENATSKDADSGGSWGVGKTAFPRASGANALFALTTRQEDDRTVLMGSMTLRTRHVDGVKFSPDAWFGLPEPGEDEGGVIQPVEDPDMILNFRDQFRLHRPLSGSIEERMGTSVVVPWCDEGLTKDSVILAVIQSNFLPIINGNLKVIVADEPDGEQVLDPDTIESIAKQLEDADLLATIRLAKWVREKGEAARVSAVHEPGANSVKWDQYELPEAERERLRERFDTGRPVIIRVPVPMKRRGGGGIHTSYLEVSMQRTEHGNTIKPVFVRGSVAVPDPKIKQVPGAVAIIRTERDDLGNLLRAAEDPGHKEWSAGTDKFKDIVAKFVYASGYLALVREAARRVHRLLQDDAAEVDFDVLSDVFSLPRSPDEDGVKRGQKGKKKKTKTMKKPTIKKKVRLAEAWQVAGGFRVARSNTGGPAPERITVGAGYDRRNAEDPVSKWHPADFELDKEPIQIQSSGLEIEQCAGNHITAKVTDPDFHLTVTGFQPERGDVFVRYISKGRFDG